MFTTVMSMKAMLEATMVAARIQTAPRGQGVEDLALMGMEGGNRRARMNSKGRQTVAAE